MPPLYLGRSSRYGDEKSLSNPGASQQRRLQWHRRVCTLNWLCLASVLWACTFTLTGSAYTPFAWTRQTGLLLIYASFVLPIVTAVFGLFVWATRPPESARHRTITELKEPS